MYLEQFARNSHASGKMSSKAQQLPGFEDNLASKSPIGPCGYVYIYPKEHFCYDEVALLGDNYEHSKVFSLPLLCGLTVEDGFVTNVKAVHQKLDMTTVSLRLTSFHRQVFVFHNADWFPPIFRGPGLDKICQDARKLFGYSEFTKNEQRNINPSDLCPPQMGSDSCVMAVVITEGFKQRLYFGKLVALKSHIQSVIINKTEVFRIPLYDEDLFVRHDNLIHFNCHELSEYLYYASYTGLAQAFRIKNVSGLLSAIHTQFTQDRYKLPKLSDIKEYSSSVINGQDVTLMIIDNVCTELALSYGMGFLEAPHEKSKLLDFSTWEIFSLCETPEDRMNALTRWNIQQSVHVHVQLFSINSVLYVTKVAKQSNNARNDQSIFNCYYMQHGLANLLEQTFSEKGAVIFPGVPSSCMDGNAYTIFHLAYAASFSKNNLARICYYLQFCQHHKSTLHPSYNISQYVGSAAVSNVCQQCKGNYPCVCINTLFYRLKDRFPPILASSKREPYVVSGVTNTFNELDFLGNFATFKEKDDEQHQLDDIPKYTYWQLNQTITEKLEAIGIREINGNEDITGIGKMSIKAFLEIFKTIDSIVDTESVKFINSLTKNNINFRESIKGIYHIIQFCCNPYWQSPCSILFNLFWRSLFVILQDIALPICAMYDADNPSFGMHPSEWLKIHYQTLWTNFKSFFLDKGVITGSELKVVHSDMFSDFFDTEAASNNMLCPSKVQVRLTRGHIIVPKNLKFKNRILFSGASISDQYQTAFLKTLSKKDTYIINGPFIKFLNAFHSSLFPNLKISALYLWSMFSKKRQIPVLNDVDTDLLMNLFAFVDSNSKLFEETNLFDLIPDSFITYAKQRLNNAILRACGQTQFYAGTLHAIVSKIQIVDGEEFPHILGETPLTCVEDYLSKIKGCKAMTVNTSLRESASAISRTRPIVTLPIVVNKYTGITGNAQLFQSGNVGYFLGRGVDKNLLGDTSFFKKQINSFMRKRYMFMTPIVGNLIKQNSSQSINPYDFENIKKNIQSILEGQHDHKVFSNVVCELIKGFGHKCKDLTLDDLQFYLGQFYIFAENILEKISILAEIDGAWTVEWALDILESQSTGYQDIEFIEFTESPRSIEENTTLNIPAANVNRKRKIVSLLDSIDLS
ncbi:major DNA binding protein [Porcine lymphotropic herpesvirus 2]|uniref:Major DNA binding protein n=1 Tax=Suid gammaherpesvirus 4 TaxID=1960250 RepID=Q8B3X5_9GAMA|nr:major DNA binding protein [Porcine lymphotropic herpesvirus 2]AAO12351.1 major DNA binding protein [Porcine lymphotropic herpesvirus 2]